MKTARFVVDRFGSIGKLAAALGHKHRSTVQKWLEVGYIPAKHQIKVLAAAQDNGIVLTPAHLICGPSGQVNGAAKRRKR